LFITSQPELLLAESVRAVDVRDLLLQHVFGAGAASVRAAA
jgi:hypothetical protein